MRRRVLLIVLLSASILAGLGCTTAVINPGTETAATYRFGRLTANIQADITSTYQATEKAMEQLGLNIVQKTQDQLEAKVTARDAQDKKVVVTLLSTTDQTTKLTITVGSMVKARRIHDMIVDSLPEG